MPLSQYFNGKVYITPGAASKVDTSALIASTLGVSGAAGVIGYCDGGKPKTLLQFLGTNPDRAKRSLIGGDLLEGVNILFDPANDNDIAGGAQLVYAIQPAPATQAQINNRSNWPWSLYTSVDGDVGDVLMRMKSRIYGTQGNFVKRQIAATTTGRTLSVQNQGTTEASGELGEAAALTFTRPGYKNYDNAIAGVHKVNMFDYDHASFAAANGPIKSYKDFAASLPSGSAIFSVAANVAFSSDLTGPTWNASGLGYLPDYIQAKSSASGDTNKKIRVIGIVDNGDGTTSAKAIVVTLNGTSAVTVVDDDDAEYLFTSVCGVELIDSVSGTITLETTGDYDADPVTTVVTVPNTSTTAGLRSLYCNNTAIGDGIGVYGEVDVSGVADTGGVLVGVDSNDVTVYAKVEFDGDGQGYAVNHGMVRITGIYEGHCKKTSLHHLVYLQSDQTGINTISKLVSDIVSATGLNVASTYDQAASFFWSNLDYEVPMLSTVWPALWTAADFIVSASHSFYARTYDLVRWTNLASEFAEAERVTGEEITGLESSVFKSGWFSPRATDLESFSGGDSGRTLARFSDWQYALDLLKQIRVNTVVALISETDNQPLATAAEIEANDDVVPDVSISASAVHAAVLAHCKEMMGVSERNSYVGVKAATKDALKASAKALAHHQISMTAQRLDRYDVDGVLTNFPEWSSACAAAGSQCGSPVGVPLTYKYVNAVGVTWENQNWNGTGWHPIYDSDELILAGVMFLTEVPGIGWRWAKHRTTHLQDDLDIYTQGNMVEAVNYFQYTWREALKNAFVGKRTLGDILKRVTARSAYELGQLEAQNVIVAGSENGQEIPAWREHMFTQTENKLEGRVTASFVTGIDFVFLTTFASPVVNT